MKFWTIEPDWAGETAFIICGGTSVTQADVDRIKGRRTIVLNSSYTRALWADILFFADERWWTRETGLATNQLMRFKGKIVTISQIAKGSRLVRLRRTMVDKGALATRRNTVAMERTSLQGALNICYHKGVKRIVLLGADNRDGPDGRAHHHDEYPWSRRINTWEVKFAQLKLVVEPIAAAGIEVINCSPISALPWWPKMALREYLESEEKAR